jgi:hypothetical protein
MWANLEAGLPAWARPVIPGGTSPLLYAGSLAGRPAAVLAFEPRRSDLPLRWRSRSSREPRRRAVQATRRRRMRLPQGARRSVHPAGAAGVRVERQDGSVDSWWRLTDAPDRDLCPRTSWASTPSRRSRTRRDAVAHAGASATAGSKIAGFVAGRGRRVAAPPAFRPRTGAPPGFAVGLRTSAGHASRRRHRKLRLGSAAERCGRRTRRREPRPNA